MKFHITSIHARDIPSLAGAGLDPETVGAQIRELIPAADRRGHRARADAVIALHTTYTGGHMTDAEAICWMDRCLAWQGERLGPVIASGGTWPDGEATVHVVSVPITEDGRLSGSEVVGNRFRLYKLNESARQELGNIA